MLPFTLGVFVFNLLCTLRAEIWLHLCPEQRVSINSFLFTSVAVNERSSSILKDWADERVYKLTDVLPGVKTAAVVMEHKAC